MITAREVLGKDKASDLTEGKMTLVMIHGLKHSIRLDPSQLTSEKAIDSAIKDLKDAGSIDYAMEKAAEILRVGKSRLAKLGDSEAKSKLLKLADYMISRAY